MLDTFARTVTTVNVWVGRTFHWLVLVLFLLLFGDVVMRYLQESPIAWSAQASKLIFGVYAIIGGGYLLARREHVNVDLFYASFSKRTKAFVDLITSFLFFLFIVILLKESYFLAVDSVTRMEVSYETTWRAPLWPSKIMIVVAAALLLLQGIVKFIADIRILLGKDVDETIYGPVNDDGTNEKESV